MRRLNGSSRLSLARYILAPLAPAALCFVGCDAELPTGDMEFPGLEEAASWNPSTAPVGDVGCIKVIVKERSLSLPNTPEKPVSGMRLLATSTDYTHIGGAMMTNSAGEAILEVKKGKEITFSYTHPSGFKLVYPQGGVSTNAPCKRTNALLGLCQCGTAGLYLTQCGNGILQGSQLKPPGTEECDDGNTIDHDGCTNSCTLPKCGDGIVNANDECDDGNTTNGDMCDNNCTFSTCGNGIKANGEECDDGDVDDGDGCDSNCTITTCGNGILTAGEECDDGNLNSGDGCDFDCTPTGCGNGVLTAGEQCDDGNTTSGDGCDVNCKPTGCGNGVITVNEACDDGNTTSGDGCSSNCLREIGQPCTANMACASGFCDPAGNTCACDADADCAVGTVCNMVANPNVCAPAGCGNNVKEVNLGEGCDDGNVNNGDGCNSQCLKEIDQPCTLIAPGECATNYCDPTDNKCRCDQHSDCPNGMSCNVVANPNQCVPPACGNNVIEPGEVCDDGNLVNGDGCDANCKPTGCGNGVITAGEVCDDGNGISGDGCDANCKPTGCGNGIVTTGETCDDGNLVNGDGCDSNCKPTGCGNGIVTGTEECDDGNQINNDGCTNQCKLPKCGDMIVQPGEYCDDGNTNNLDSCNNSCVAPSGVIWTGGFNGASNGTDQGFAVAGVGDSDVYVAGNVSVVGQGRNAWLGRFTKAGGLPLWSVHFNGPANGNDYAYGVAADPQTGAAVTIGTVSTASGGFDIVVRKHNASNGSQLWAQTYSTINDDIGYDVAVDEAGNIVAVGTRGGATPYFWIAKYNSSGTMLWTNLQAGTTNFAMGTGMSVRMDAQGNITTCGFEISQSSAPDKIWVIKHNTNGGNISAITFNAPTGYHPNAVAADANGDILVTGYVVVPGQDENIWIQKYTSLGAPIWSNTYNDPAANYWDRGNDVSTDSARNVLVTGYTYVNNEGVNVWLRKLSPTGTILWTKSYNGPANANDYGMGIAAHPSPTSLDNVLVTGYDAVSGQGSNVWVRAHAP